MHNLELVDNLAKSYNYTHEQVLNLELEFTYTLLWLHIEQEVERARINTLLKLMKKWPLPLDL